MLSAAPLAVVLETVDSGGKVRDARLREPLHHRQEGTGQVRVVGELVWRVGGIGEVGVAPLAVCLAFAHNLPRFGPLARTLPLFPQRPALHVLGGAGHDL